MKNLKPKRMLCLMVSAMLLFSFTACKKGGITESGASSEVVTESDFTEPSDSGEESAPSNDPSPASSAQSSPSSGPAIGSGPKTSLTIDQVVAKMPSSLKGTTLTFLFWEDITNLAYKDAVAKFEAKTGIKFKTEIVTKSEYDAQLAARISAGNSPDMFKVLYNNPSNCVNLQPITATGYDFNDTAWDDEIIRDFTFNGRVYAVNVKNSPNCNASIIIYNKKALKRAGLADQDPYTLWKNNPDSWTWSKLWSMCEAFVKANNNADGYFGISVWDKYAASLGGGFMRYDPSQGKVVNLVNSSATIKGYETVIDAISKNWATSVSDSTAFTTGKVLFACAYSSILEKNNGFEMLAKQGNLGAAPMPTDSSQQPLIEYSSYGVPVGAKNAAAVPYFLRIVMSPEGNDLNQFYIDSQAREVAEFTAAKNNKFFVEGWNYEINQKLLAGTASQVKSILDSYVGTVQENVDAANALIANLPK